MSATEAKHARFPVEGLMPRTETRADEFTRANPSFDGRGVVVAIFDTGVDPAALGLQKTSDGRPKVVDVVECTGSGDVAMAKPQKSVPQSSGSGRTIKGITGRDLLLNPEWNNPKDEWRVGAKVVKELYATTLDRRMSSTAKSERARRVQRLVGEAKRALQAWDASNLGGKPSSTLTGTKKQDREELQARVDALSKLDSALSKDDPGPCVDVVCWHDGAVWRAAVDASFSGNMRSSPGLANFRVERQYATLDEDSQLSYCLNVYDDGDVVSIVTDAGSHGTHVASITAGCHHDAPEYDGVAPGAQIVALKIGDTRLGSMETLQGLQRALRAVVDNGCDVINMSYGEPSLWPDWGRFVELANDTVNDKGVVFVASAGNNGPALTTSGSPGATSSCIISVAALVSPTMAEAEYGARRGTALKPYTWSSRGPTMDGELGVTVGAPGSAIASIPTWNLQGKQQMNGTSMSSPNMAGCVALLLSAAKASGLSWTPASIRRCIQNAAAPVPGAEVWAVGRGMVDVVATWDLMQAAAKRADEEAQRALQAARTDESDGIVQWAGIAETAPEPSFSPSKRGAAVSADPGQTASTSPPAPPSGPAPASGRQAAWQHGLTRETRLSVDGEAAQRRGMVTGKGEDFSFPDMVVSVGYQGAGAGAPKGRGVYWREPAQSASSQEVTVSVRPQWKAGVHPRVKTAFDRKYKLVSTADWVECAGHLHVSSRGANFSARIDADQIGRTGAHYAEIRGFCLAHGSADECEQTGPDFFVPITVVIAEGAESLSPNGVDTGYTFVSQTRGDATSTQGHPGQADAAAARPASGAPTTIAFGPGHLERRFILVPPGASWCDISIKRVDAGSDEDNLAAGTADEGVASSGAGADGGKASLFGTPGRRAQLGSTQASILDEDARSGGALVTATGTGSGTASGAGGEQPVVDASSRIIAVHAVQVRPHVSLHQSGKERYMRLRPGEENSMGMGVVAGLTLEVCVGQYWSSLGSSGLQVQVRFRGVSVQGSGTFSSGSGMLHLRPQPLMHDVLVKPEAKLTHWHMAVPPSKFVAEAMGERDTHTDGARLSRLEVRYEVTAPASGSFVPRVGGLHGGRLLYEAPFDSHLVVAHEADTGKIIGTSDAKGDAISLSSGTKYVFRVQAVLPKASDLEQLKTQPLYLMHKLSSAITLKAHGCKGDALTGGSGYSMRKLRRYVQDDVFFGLPASSKLPKKAKAGDYLSGNVQFCDYESAAGALNKGRHPSGEQSIAFYLGPSETPKEASAELPAVPKASGGSKPASSEASSSSGGAAASGAGSDGDAGSSPDATEKEVAEAVRDASVSALKKLKSRAAFDLLHDALLKEHPEHLPLLQARLDFEVDALRKEDPQGTGLDVASVRVAVAADAVVAACNPDELAAYFGRKVYEDELEGDELKRHKDMVSKKKDLVKALSAKASAFVRCVPALARAGKESSAAELPAAARSVLATSGKADGGAGATAGGNAAQEAENNAVAEAFGDAVRELGVWKDLSGSDKKGELAVLLAERHVRAGRPAKALMLVHGCIDDGAAASFEHLGGTAAARSCRAALVAALGWDVFSESIERAEAGLRAHKAQCAAPL